MHCDPHPFVHGSSSPQVSSHHETLLLKPTVQQDLFCKAHEGLSFVLPERQYLFQALPGFPGKV